MIRKLTRLVFILLFFFTIVFLNLWLILSICHAGSLDINGSLDVGASFINSVNDSRSVYLNYESVSDNYELNSRFQYGKINDTETQNNLYFRFGYDSPINKRWSLWIFDKVGYDRIQKINLENFAGVGPKYIFHKTNHNEASISFGYVPHFQKFESYSKTTNRLSLRLRAKEYVETDYEIKIALSYQPNIENSGDYLLNGELSWKYKLVRSTSIKVSIIDQYRSLSEVGNELIGVVALSFEL